MLPTLSRSRHIVVPGSGHITLTRGCVPQLVGKFLETADPAAIDPACVEALARPPFFVTPTGPAAPATPATAASSGASRP